MKKKMKKMDDGKVRFKREIGLLEATSITLGAIIGSGIFIAPKGIVASVGSVGLSLVIWVASGVLASVGALCYTELGTAFPSSGGDYHYLYEAFGPLPAFLYLWASIMIFVPCDNAILSLSFAQYVLQPFFTSDCGIVIPDIPIQMLAAVAIGCLTFLNCYDTRGAAKIQNVFSFAKLAALFLIIITGFITIFNGGYTNFNNAFENSNTGPGNISLAFYSGVYSYGGANVLNCMVEEVKSPSKTLPRAIYISMSIIIVAYVMVNAAYFTVLSPADMLNSEAVAVVRNSSVSFVWRGVGLRTSTYISVVISPQLGTFGEKTLGRFAWIISLFVAISTFGGLAISTMMSSRILFSGARHGHFPKMLAHLQLTRLTPMPSLIFLSLLSAVYLFAPNVHSLINYAGFMYSIVAVGVAGSVLYLRWTKPDQPRPIRVPLIYPVIYLFVSLFLLILPIYVAPMEAGISGLITLTGIPVYFLFVRPEKRPAWLEKKLNNWTVLLQKFFISLPSE